MAGRGQRFSYRCEIASEIGSSVLLILERRPKGREKEGGTKHR